MIPNNIRWSDRLTTSSEVPLVASDGGNESRPGEIASSAYLVTRDAGAFIHFCCLKAEKALLWTGINGRDLSSHFARPRTRQPTNSVRVSVPYSLPIDPRYEGGWVGKDGRPTPSADRDGVKRGGAFAGSQPFCLLVFHRGEKRQYG